MNEIWTQWKPIDGLSYGYYIDAINDTFDGFSVWLAEDQERSKRLQTSNSTKNAHDCFLR